MSSDPGYIPNEWNLSSSRNMFPTGVHSVDPNPAPEKIPDIILTNSRTIGYPAGTYGHAYIYGGRNHNSGKHGAFYFKAMHPAQMPGMQLGNIESIIYSDDYEFLEGERVNVRVQPDFVNTELTSRNVLEEFEEYSPSKNIEDLL